MKHIRLQAAFLKVAVLISALLPVLSTLAWSQKTSQSNPSSSTLVLDFDSRVSNAQGQAAAAKLLQALGGADEVNAVKTLRQKVTIVKQGQRIEGDQTIVYPDKQTQKMRLPQGTVLRVVTPTSAFMVTGSKVQDLSARESASSQAALKHDFLNVLQHLHDKRYAFDAIGDGNVGDTVATVVDVSADDVPTRWWIGPDGKLLQERFTDTGQDTPTTLTFRYSDWKKFGGLDYPTKYLLLDEGDNTVLTMTLTAMEINPDVDSKIFEKPAK